MRRSVLALSLVLVAAGPALAQSEPAAKPKMKRVCTMKDSGNPLWPDKVCHMVPVETAAAAPAPDPTAGRQPAASSATATAQNSATGPHY